MASKADRTQSPVLVGLDDRPRPAGARERILRGLRQSAPFSSLQRRIIFFNLAGLAVLVIGALYLNQFRSGLIEQRLQSLRVLGEVIAITLGERMAVDPADPAYDPAAAGRGLARVVAPANLSARLYDARLRLIADTSPEPSEAADPQADGTPEAGDLVARVIDSISEAYEGLEAALNSQSGIRRAEPEGPGISRDRIVRAAARGSITSAVRVNAEDQLIVSVALPVQRGGAAIGVLVLSTVGDDINDTVRAERATILQVFVIASIVSTGLSIVLANTIARPIRKLAAAADSEGTNAHRPLNPERIEIPDLTRRTDEIGELSAALTRMTDALYRRIEAIESFASDVAHEIKNPLTSLRSAVETMALARTPEQRQQLLEVIQKDVSRMDRLVTDISNASRLDAELVRERLAPFDLGGLVDMLASVFADQAEARGLNLEVVRPEGVLTARGLETRIAQVITNFVDNAVSFSPPGGTVWLTVERAGENLRVAVEDEGPGVPADNRESVFTRFYTERPESEEFGNHSGLGLAISRQIIEAHGGRVWCEDRPAPADGSGPAPRGARFAFELRA